MLDSSLNPYIYDDGEKVHIALALDHLEVTDSTILADLNSDLELVKKVGNQARALPTNFEDLSTGDVSSNSPEYTQNISWGSSESIMTRILKFEAQHTYVRVKSTDLDKVEWYSSDNISFTYFYYYELQDVWYSQCTIMMSIVIVVLVRRLKYLLALISMVNFRYGMTIT